MIRLQLVPSLIFVLLTVNVQADDKAIEFFETKIRPVLIEHCYECHSGQAKSIKGGLRLDFREEVLRGGESGPAIVPGKPDQSLIVQAVRHESLEMPPKGPLPNDVIEDIVRWVELGAPDPRDSASGDSLGHDRADRRTHWAFLPIAEPSHPEVRDKAWPQTNADFLILKQLEDRGLRPVTDADRYTWLRRVSLDLTGWPPSSDEIRQFVADDSPDAYTLVVDRLLNSPSFGERWARHWLDLVGYADQIGTANDLFAEHAWRYRDYVIAAFNDDQPFDQFVREQLAGDLLPYDSPQQRASNLIATGFLLLGDIAVVEADKAKLRVDVVDQQVDKVGKALLGMTLGCARCHDHKFDPISQDDYYAMAGFFYSTESVQRTKWGVWSGVKTETLPETASQQSERAVKEREYAVQLAALQTARDEAGRRFTELEANLQSKTGNQPSESTGANRKERDQLAERIKQLDQRIEHAKFFVPSVPLAFSVRDLPEPTDMQVTIRGNPHALGKVVARGFMSAAADGHAAAFGGRTSGRRELADWLVSPHHPLTSRVAVNRIWQKLFGTGIVKSVDYFGVRGETPTNPELLDYLASQFMRQGWSHKRFIRSLVLSHTYRLSSNPEPNAQAADPENRLLWRMNRGRLDAEALRDSLLSVSGQLVHLSGRPALPLEFPENVGNLKPGDVNPPSFRLVKFRPEQPWERTVYLPVIRSGPQPGPAELRNIFDFTQPAEIMGERRVTAVPTQALFIINGTLLKERAVDIARSVLAHVTDAESRVDDLWLRVLNRPVTADERADAHTFLSDVRNQLAHMPATESEAAAWSELCHALLGSNEFLMRL